MIDRHVIEEFAYGEKVLMVIDIILVVVHVVNS